MKGLKFYFDKLNSINFIPYFKFFEEISLLICQILCPLSVDIKIIKDLSNEIDKLDEIVVNRSMKGQV